MKENITYTEAITRLEQLTKAIEDGTLDIDNLAINLKEAQELLKVCKEKLSGIEEEVNKILQSDGKE